MPAPNPKPLPPLRLPGQATPPPLPPPAAEALTPPTRLAAVPPPLLDAASVPPAAIDPWSGFSIAAVKRPSGESRLVLPPPKAAAHATPVSTQPPPLPPAAEPPRDKKPRRAVGAGDRIGPYDLKELIGEGGMGLVFKAEDTLLRRAAAVKLVKPEIARDERALKLFLSEAQATASLKDDRIATIYQVGEDHRQLYLAMELLHGESLESRLRRGPVSIETAVWVAREAALGLAVAHRAGFVHRDIKPANLWLEAAEGYKPRPDPLGQFRPDAARETAFKRVKILDFGLARLGPAAAGSDVVGTPLYMAPEQAAGHTADARSDLFGLGVTLYRMLTARLPFDGETHLEVMTAMATTAAPPVTQANPHVPAALGELVARMISRDPLARPGSADDVVRLLEAIERHVLLPEAKPVVGRKRNVKLIAGVAAGVMALALAGWWFGFRGEDSGDGVPVAATLAPGGVRAPDQVLDAVGDEVTVEFVVGHVKKVGGAVHLAERAPGKDEKAFRVIVPGPVVADLKRRGAPWPDGVLHARLRLHGVVAREGRFAEILVADMDQLDKILYGDGKPSKPAVPVIGADQPATTGPTTRSPRHGAKETGEELTDSVEEAAKKVLKSFGATPGGKK